MLCAYNDTESGAFLDSDQACARDSGLPARTAATIAPRFHAYGITGTGRPVRAAVFVRNASAVRFAGAASGQKETKMPKLKTKSGVKKRFKFTATGKVKHGVAGKRHRLISHNAKYIRQNRGTEVLSEADVAHVRLWAPYGLK